MKLRHHSQRTKDLHLNQPSRRIQQTASEHDMPNNLPVVLGDQRETVLDRDGVPQRIDQISHNRPMITKRLQVNLPHSLPVTRKFSTKLHPRRLKAPLGPSHTVLEPE